MRTALFSDIHSNYHALETVLADAFRQGVDRLICLGDITLKGPLPQECVSRIRDLGCPVVLGNTDAAYHPQKHPSRYPIRNNSQRVARADFARHMNVLSQSNQRWLYSRPLTLTEEWEGVRMDFFHATPWDNYVLIMPWASNEELAGQRLSDRTRVSGFGHSHRAFVRTVDGRLVVNCGSVGLPFDGDPRPSYVILEVERGTVSASIRRVSYPAEAAIRTARDVGMLGWELFAYTARRGLFPG